MFDFSLGELSLVIIIGLIVLGPKQLADTIKTTRKWLHALRKLVQSVENEVNNELQIAELNDSIKQITELTQTTHTTELLNEIETLKLQILSLEQSFKEQQTISHQSHEMPVTETTSEATASSSIPSTETK